MIITCPNCHTRYQIAQNAIGSAGRKVLCASCNQPWQAIAEKEAETRSKIKLVEEKNSDAAKDDDKLFDEEAEAKLDTDFENAEAETKDVTTIKTRRETDKKNRRSEDIVKKKKKKLKQEKQKSDFIVSKKQKEMDNRQAKKAKKFPRRRMQRQLQFFVVISFLLIIVGGVFLKNYIVRTVPQLAVVYKVFGQPVNIFGLEFDEVKTLRSANDGIEKMSITAKIKNISNKQVNVPMVVVSIVDESDKVLLKWSVTPYVQTIGAGESIDFETQLNAAPDGANNIKLSFDENGNF